MCLLPYLSLSSVRDAFLSWLARPFTDVTENNDSRNLSACLVHVCVGDLRTRNITFPITVPVMSPLLSVRLTVGHL